MSGNGPRVSAQLELICGDRDEPVELDPNHDLCGDHANNPHRIDLVFDR